MNTLRPVTTRLEALRTKLFWRIVLSGIPRILLAAALLALGTFALDYFMDLPVAVRAVLLVLSLGLIGLVAWRHLLKPLTGKPDVDELALMVESADPEIKDQLISAIQLERDLEARRNVESPELIRALVDDTAKRFEARNFTDAISLAPCRRPLLLGGGAVALVMLLALLFPGYAGIWGRRQLLLRDEAWPRETTLIITILDIEKYDPRTENDRTVLFVPERTPLQVQVTAQGKLPDEVDLITAPLDDPDVEATISMGRPQSKDYFQHIFPPLTRSILLYVQGGDDDDEEPLYELRVARAPRVVAFYADYDYPDYTGVEDRALPDANISAPEGTRVTMHFKVNMELASFEVERESEGKRLLEAGSDAEYRYSFVVDQNDFYTYRLKGSNGVISADLPRYVITAEADQAPRVAVEMPSYTLISVSPNATIPLRGIANDDYGITEVGLRYGTGRGALDWGGVQFPEEDLLAALGSRQLPFFHELQIAQLRMPAKAAEGDRPATPERAMKEGDRFAFRFLVADNRIIATNPEPHRPFGDYEYQVQVLSTEELQRELGARQVRMKERIQGIANLVESRIDDTRALLDKVKTGGDGAEDLRSMFWQIEQDQNRITQELVTSTRRFYRVFDGYLWNRLDPGNLTEQLIARISQLYRENSEAEVDKIHGQALADLKPIIDESALVGRLAVILEILLRTSTDRSPEAQRNLARANLVNDPEERVALVEAALESQNRLQQDVMLLVDKLEAWEDILDVIQGFRDLMDLQRGIHRNIEKLTDK